MALVALGLAPGMVLADRDRGHAQAASEEIEGVISSLPATAGWVGDWKVDDRTVRVGPDTRLEQKHGEPAVGAHVEVKGQPQADGTLRATEVEVKSRAGRS
jgi:hypothetical protein